MADIANQVAPEGAPEADRRDSSPENQYRRSIFSVPVSVTVSVGRQKISVSELLDLQEDAILPLATPIDGPVELIVEGRVIALGELIEGEDGGLAVRITEIAEDSNG